MLSWVEHEKNVYNLEAWIRVEETISISVFFLDV